MTAPAPRSRRAFAPGLPFLNLVLAGTRGAPRYSETVSKSRVALFVVAALVLPVALVTASYFISARSFATSGGAPAIPSGKIAKPPAQRPSPKPSASASPSVEGEDLSGPCDEPEHANDPECRAGAVGEDSDDSGRGRSRGSGGDESGRDNSGSGRDHPEDD